MSKVLLLSTDKGSELFLANKGLDVVALEGGISEYDIESCDAVFVYLWPSTYISHETYKILNKVNSKIPRYIVYLRKCSTSFQIYEIKSMDVLSVDFCRYAKCIFGNNRTHNFIDLIEESKHKVEHSIEVIDPEAIKVDKISLDIIDLGLLSNEDLLKSI